MTLRLGASHGKQDLVKFGVNRSSTKGDMMYLIWLVISHDHLIERSCRFMGRCSLQHITALINVVTLRPFSIQLKNPSRLKILPRFS